MVYRYVYRWYIYSFHDSKNRLIFLAGHHLFRHEDGMKSNYLPRYLWWWDKNLPHHWPHGHPAMVILIKLIIWTSPVGHVMSEKRCFYAFFKESHKIERHVPFLPAWSKTSAKTSKFFSEHQWQFNPRRSLNVGDRFSARRMSKCSPKQVRKGGWGENRQHVAISEWHFSCLRERLSFYFVAALLGFTSILHMSHLICEDMSSERSEMYEWFPKIKAASGYSIIVHPVLETFINIWFMLHFVIYNVYRYWCTCHYIWLQSI